MGDTYMAVSGLPDPCENHAQCISRVALDMLEMAKNVKMGPSPVVNIIETCLLLFKLISLSLFTFIASYHWYSFWRGGDGSNRQQSTKVLPFRQHSEFD